MAWGILHDIEVTVDNAEEAQMARHQARAAYLAYRQNGGYAKAGPGGLCDNIFPVLRAGQIDQVTQAFTQLEIPEEWYLFINKLKLIIAGSRDKALADDMALNYNAAAEILLLLERLAETE